MFRAHMGHHQATFFVAGETTALYTLCSVVFVVKLFRRKVPLYPLWRLVHFVVYALKPQCSRNTVPVSAVLQADLWPCREAKCIRRSHIFHVCSNMTWCRGGKILGNVVHELSKFPLNEYTEGV
jgi:hypothetical protein